MAQKETDLLRDPLKLAQSRYQEQIQAFKEQYIPRRKNPIRQSLEEEGVSLRDWRNLFK